MNDLQKLKVAYAALTSTRHAIDGLIVLLKTGKVNFAIASMKSMRDRLVHLAEIVRP